MRLADLNDDVLLRILDYLDVPSIHAFTLTCGAARSLAMPVLLREVTLRSGWAQILSFCQFVLADVSYRAPLIRILRLSSKNTVKLTLPRPSRDSGTLNNIRSGTRNKPIKRFFSHKATHALPYLQRVLTAACNLHTIGVSSTLGVVMVPLPLEYGIYATLRQAPALAHVLIDREDDIRHVCHGLSYCSWERWTGRQEWFRLLSGMRGLRTIELSAVPGASLRTVLYSHRETLERLDLRGELNHAVFTGRSQWAKVKELVLHNLAAREMLVQAFPSVEYLELDTEPDGRVFYSNPTARVNMESELCWPKLDHVRGTSLGIMSMALKCPVRRLDVDLTQMPSLMRLAPQYSFQEILKATKPAVLSLRIPSWFTVGYCRNVAASVPELKSFNLEIYHDEHLPRDAKDLLSMFLAIVLTGFQSVVYMSIRICHTAPVASLSSLPVYYPAEVVPYIASSLPALQYLELSWEDIGWRRCWWRKEYIEPNPNARDYAIYPISTSMGLAARRRCMQIS